MRDDIPTLLRDAAADPSHTPDFDALAARGAASTWPPAPAPHWSRS